MKGAVTDTAACVFAAVLHVIAKGKCDFSFHFQADSNSPVWQQMNASYSNNYSYAKNGETLFPATARSISPIYNLII